MLWLGYSACPPAMGRNADGVGWIGWTLAYAVAYRYRMLLDPSNDNHCSGAGVTTECSALHP
jgi:hypothetical protein